VEIELNVPTKYRVWFNVVRYHYTLTGYVRLNYGGLTGTLEEALALLLEAQTKASEYRWEVIAQFDKVGDSV